MYVAPGGILTPAHVYVTRWKFSTWARIPWRSTTTASTKKNSFYTNSASYQVLTRGEDSIGPIGSSLEAEFPERRKSKHPRATSTVQEVLWRITDMHSDNKNDEDKILKYESVFHYYRISSHYIQYSIAITTFL